MPLMLPRTLEPEVMDDEAESRAYEAMDHAAPNAAFADRLIELGAFGRVLDIGTGPGHIPLLIAERLPESRIVGVDLAPSMLRLAERRRAASSHRDRIVFQPADAKALPFADGGFQTVCSNTLLHHLPEPAAFLREAARVLAAGGVLLIRDLFRPAAESDVRALVARHAAEADAAQQKLFADSLRAALTPDELRETADRAGLTHATITVDTDRHMSLQIRKG